MESMPGLCRISPVRGGGKEQILMTERQAERSATPATAPNGE
jgi:hypothetical protein